MPLDLARPGSLVDPIELEDQMLDVSPAPSGYAGQVEQGLRASALERRQGRDIEAELLFGEVQEALVLGGNSPKVGRVERPVTTRPRVHAELRRRGTSVKIGSARPVR